MNDKKHVLFIMKPIICQYQVHNNKMREYSMNKYLLTIHGVN